MSDEGEPGHAVGVVGGDLGQRLGWDERPQAEVSDDPGDRGYGGCYDTPHGLQLDSAVQRPLPPECFRKGRCRDNVIIPAEPAREVLTRRDDEMLTDPDIGSVSISSYR